MMRSSCLSAALLIAALSGWAASSDLLTPVGRWKTVDDKTGKPKAIVLIYTENGRLFGKVEATLDPNAKKVCEKCKDERRNQAIIGMVILRGMVLHSGEYTGGDILDPDNGSIYRCKMHLEEHGSKLSVRGFIGFSLLGRSQTWTREP